MLQMVAVGMLSHCVVAMKRPLSGMLHGRSLQGTRRRLTWILDAKGKRVRWVGPRNHPEWSTSEQQPSHSEYTNEDYDDEDEDTIDSGRRARQNRMEKEAAAYQLDLPSGVSNYFRKLPSHSAGPRCRHPAPGQSVSYIPGSERQFRHSGTSKENSVSARQRSGKRHRRSSCTEGELNAMRGHINIPKKIPEAPECMCDSGLTGGFFGYTPNTACQCKDLAMCPCVAYHQ